MAQTEKAAAEKRSDAVYQFKRHLILGAAQALFAERGIDAASLRDIAKAAGYTTGAICTYFSTKGHLYAEVLRGSLYALHAEVSARVEASQQRSAESLRALWDFYADRPSDFDLGCYLYGGARPAGLTAELNAELNRLSGPGDGGHR